MRKAKVTKSHVSSKTHVLIQPRMLTAIGLISVWAIGVALMLAQVLIVVGLFISCLTSAGVLWLYAIDVYYLIKRWRLPSDTVLIKEMIIVFPSAIAMITIAFVVFRQENTEYVANLLANGANIHVTSVPVPKMRTDGTFYFPIVVSSNGRLPAIRFASIFGTGIYEKILTDDEIDRSFKARLTTPLAQMIRVGEADKKISNNTADLSSGSTEWVIPDERLDQATFAKIRLGKSFLYVFFLMRYTDQKSYENGIYYYSSYCARYNADYRTFNICQGHNFDKRAE